MSITQNTNGWPRKKTGGSVIYTLAFTVVVWHGRVYKHQYKALLIDQLYPVTNHFYSQSQNRPSEWFNECKIMASFNIMASTSGPKSTPLVEVRV